MESNKLSLEELIQLAGKVKDWKRLADAEGYSVKSDIINNAPVYLRSVCHPDEGGDVIVESEWASRTKSYRGLVGELEITVAHQHTITNGTNSLGLLSYGFYTKYGRSKSEIKATSDDSHWVYATLRGITVGSHSCDRVYVGQLRDLYNSVKATYNQTQKERQERAERYALRGARALL